MQSLRQLLEPIQVFIVLAVQKNLLSVREEARDSERSRDMREHLGPLEGNSRPGVEQPVPRGPSLYLDPSPVRPAAAAAGPALVEKPPSCWGQFQHKAK